MNPVLGQPPMYNPYGSVPPMPAGWVEHRTPTGQPYWYSTLTGQSSWVYPMAPVVAAAAAAPVPAKKKKQIKKKIPGTQWLFVLTHDGYEFYYDRETKKSVWEMPEDLKEPMKQLKKLEAEAEVKKKEEEEAKKKEEEAQREKEAEESRKRALLEEEEQQLEAKRVKLESDITNDAKEDLDKEQELDATEMTEEDIMWQLQQMAEEEVEGEDEGEYQLQQQREEEKQEEPPQVVVEKKKSEEECIAKFNELLQERNISPFAMYSTEYPQLMNDPRFSLVPANKQKSLFNKYCNGLGEKIRNEKNKNNKKPEDEFKELLVSKVKVKMYWDDFRRKYKDDIRFKAISTTKEREALFKEHIKHNLNKDPIGEYMNLLATTKEIKDGIRWRDAKKILEKDDRFYAIEDKNKREDLFRDYLAARK